MTELLFIVTGDAREGFDARAVGSPIVARAGSDVGLEQRVREAVVAHFAESADEVPRLLHLHFVRDRTIPLQAEDAGPAEAFPLRGTVSTYVDPFEPACDPDEWDANR